MYQIVREIASPTGLKKVVCNRKVGVYYPLNVMVYVNDL